jgi:hypothetical protein
MPGNFDPVLVGLFNRRFQLRPREHVVSLERAYAFADPVLHGAARVVGIFERVHLAGEGAIAFEIGPGHVDLGANHLSVIDAALQLQIKVGLDASCGADRRNPSRKIQAREAERHVVIEPAAGRVEKMIVHTHQSGDRRVAGEVHPIGIRGNLHRSCSADGGDLVAGDQDGLIGFGRGAGAVDQAHMFERDHARGDLDKVLGL